MLETRLDLTLTSACKNNWIGVSLRRWPMIARLRRFELTVARHLVRPVKAFDRWGTEVRGLDKAVPMAGNAFGGPVE